MSAGVCGRTQDSRKKNDVAELKTWAPEWRSYTDPVSGARVTQLTDYKAHSHHLYFTNPGWYAGGTKLVIGSERENALNLYGVDLQSGEISQLTDLESRPVPHEVRFQPGCVNPMHDEFYFHYYPDIMALDLDTREILRQDRVRQHRQPGSRIPARNRSHPLQ